MTESKCMILKSIIKSFNIEWENDKNNLNKYFCCNLVSYWFDDTTKNAGLACSKDTFNAIIAEINNEKEQAKHNWFDYEFNKPITNPPLDTRIYVRNKGEIPERIQNTKCLCEVIGYTSNNQLIVDTNYGFKILRKDSEILPEDWSAPTVIINYLQKIGINYHEATSAEQTHLISLYRAGFLKGQ